MKAIEFDALREAVKNAFLSANTDVIKVSKYLERIKGEETSKTGKIILDQLIDNAATAKELNIPSCQDTGMAVVFCNIGSDVVIEGGQLSDAINYGVRDAYVGGVCVSLWLTL